MSEMNVSAVSVNRVVTILGNLYVGMIQNKVPFREIPAAFLWGAPGVGKSEAIYEIAEMMEKETGKKVNVVDVRLLLFSPIDLRGIPKADVTHQFTEWLRPKLFAFSDDEDVINLLFLDELTACPASVQAAAYQITLNRCIGEHKFPDNTIVIAAGNRTSDKSVAYRMPNALANRLMHFQVDVDFVSWKQWAVKNHIHPFVFGYLSYDASKLYLEPSGKNDVAFPTPRTWTFVSQLLKTVPDENLRGVPKELYPAVCGCVGGGTAMEFDAWCQVYREVPSVEDIYNGRDAAYPKRQDVLHALVSSMTAYAYEISKAAREDSGLVAAKLHYACLFAAKFPGDFAACYYYNLLEIDEIRELLSKVPSFLSWIRKNKISLLKK